MDIIDKLIKEENIILNEKTSLIKEKMNENEKIINQYSLQDINTYQKVDQLTYNIALKEQEKLNQALEDLYYGRLDIDYIADNEKETVYIGKKDVYINDEQIVCSWAAPIAEIYDNYNSGHYDHEYIEKKTGKKLHLEGDIKTKRKITLAKDRVVYVHSYTKVEEEALEEEYTIRKIENSKTDKLGTIIDSMNKDQSKIIRLPIEKNILVQGCAGSGKSSVAFHRLAYLAYNYELSEKELLVISPNKIFQGYTDSILFDLGTDFNVDQYTFNEFAELILGIKIDSKASSKKYNINKLKTGKTFKILLDNYIEYLDDNFIPENNELIDGFEVINSEKIKSIWKNEFAGYHINNRLKKFKTYINKYLKKRINQQIIKIDKIYDDNIKTIEKYGKKSSLYKEVVNLTKEEREIRKNRFKNQCNIIINGYIKNLKEINSILAYKTLISDNDLIVKLGEGLISKEIIKNLGDEEFSDIDYIPMLYLHYRLNVNENKYRHIAIDECQDLSYLEISIIEGLTNSFTLVGDFNQRVDINKSTASLEEINDMFKKYTYFESYYLNKSFRNSKSITNYSNEILDKYFMNNESIPIAFNRETRKPKVYYNIDNKEKIEYISKSIKEKLNSDKNIALILKDETYLNQYYKELLKTIDLKNINLIDNEYCKYGKGLNVLTAKLSKGLEFDYVIIVDGDRYEDNEEDRRLLYVATTRALHGLEIYIEEKECFITSINNELWEGEFKLEKNNINEKLETLNEDISIKKIETLPNEVKKSSDNIKKLTNEVEILTNKHIDHINSKNTNSESTKLKSGFFAKFIGGIKEALKKDSKK